MVLNDVTCDPDAVEVTGAAADPDVLGHRDLDMVDVIVVPHRLEQLVREPQRHHVLHGFFAEVMVDAEHRRGGEDAGHDAVQFPRTLQVVAERLFDHHPAPPPRLLFRQSVGAELVNDGLKQSWRNGQVERVVPVGTAGLVEVDDRLGQVAEGLLVADLTRYEPDALRELSPHFLSERGSGMLLDGRMHDLGEVLMLPGPPREPDQGETRRKQTPIGQVVDRRHQLLGRQIAGDAEDHQHARAGNPREPPILRFAKRVGTHHRDQMRVPLFLGAARVSR